MKSLREFFEDLSFKSKISLIIVLSSIVVLLLSTVLMVVSDFYYISSSLRERMLSLAKVIGENSSAALIFNDREEAKNILSTLKAERDVVGVYLFDKNNELFAFYRAPGYRKDIDPRNILNSVPDRSVLELYSEVYIKHDVVYDKEKIGTVLLGYNTDFLTKKLKWYLYVIAFVLIVAVVASIVISTRLQRVVTEPVFELIKKMNEIKEKKNYLIRVEKKSKDEIGQLIEHFNDMLDQIYQRDQKLQQHKDNLEKIVEQRTRQLQEATQKALDLAKKAQAANIAKSAFVASMSHELRTPLNAIIGFTEILVDKHYGELNPEQEEFLNDILMSARHLLNLIDDILDLTKIESGRVELEPSSVDIRELIERSVGLLKEKILKHGFKMHSIFDNTLPEYVSVDERKIKQVIFNLLTNAAKFTPDGGSIDIEVSLVTYDWIQQNIEPLFKEELTHIKDRDRDFLRISVKDTGRGIKKENLRKVFEPFQQEDDSIAKQYGGTGLGLALSREIVRLHGGIIWAESSEGRGARFTFVLPLKDHPEG